MLTLHGTGTLSQQRAAAQAMAQELKSAGFAVSRIKIEAAPDNKGVPQTDAQACQQPDDLHFEHHIKLLLPSAQEVGVLVDLVTAHGGRLSRNARRVRADGALERFVTQRFYRTGLAEARAGLNRLLVDLAERGYNILDVESEYVAFDSNVALDSGWLDQTGAA